MPPRPPTVPPRANPVAGRLCAGRIAAIAALVLATALAYRNSLDVPFLFDDVPAIAENSSIRRLWPPTPVLFPDQPGGTTSSGRPLVNLSLALNFLLGGTKVQGYHLFNLAVHVAAALTLFGLVRRTLHNPVAAMPAGTSEFAVALVIAAVWALHPIQSAAVTYIVQRAELLMGLCYLATLYCFVRGTETPGSRSWLACSGLACVAGMAAKEVMASAPLAVLVYDRVFVAGSFRVAWKCRKAYYAALALGWLVLAGLMAANAGRGGTVGFGTSVSAFDYALTQCRAIAIYLKLAVWPSPLVFDYGTAAARRFSEVWFQALVVLGAVLLIAWTWIAGRRPLGFLGFCFLAVLAPTSSIVPIATQTIAEHRMYLALIPLVAAAVVASGRWLEANKEANKGVRLRILI